MLHPCASPSVPEPCLLALAATHGGHFLTFDQRLELDLVPGAVAASLCIIGAG